MASTYYTKDQNDSPRFLMSGIRQHPIFNIDIKFWETCILQKSLNLKDAASHSVFCEDVSQAILSVAFYMNDIFAEKQIIRDICMKYVSLYKITEKSQAVITYMKKIEQGIK